MATTLKDTTDPATLYERDFHAWARHQAETLRQLQAMRPNLPLDFAHLIEEVEDLGDNRLRVAQSQTVRLIQHLLKLEYWPADRPRRQWLNTIDDARRELEWAITPTVRRELEPRLPSLYRGAARAAARDLLDHGEAEAAAALPPACPYSLDELLAETWYPANRHGLVDDVP